MPNLRKKQITIDLEKKRFQTVYLGFPFMCMYLAFKIVVYSVFDTLKTKLSTSENWISKLVNQIILQTELD